VESLIKLKTQGAPEGEATRKEAIRKQEAILLATIQQGGGLETGGLSFGKPPSISDNEFDKMLSNFGATTTINTPQATNEDASIFEKFKQI